ncbi:MAG TPA: AEC family transporter [Rhodospirillales bacterium]|nr:AEC family transporter [Rhodospirillales bacterium]
MSGTIAALFPVFAVIVLGYGLRRGRFVEDGFWAAAERITFYVFFPALLVSSTAKASLAGLDVGAIALALLGAIGLVLAIARALHGPLHLNGPAYSSLIQSAIRPNVYVAFSAAAALFGRDGLTAISLCIAVVVPAVNVISVYVLVRHGAGPDTGTAAAAKWRRVVAGVAANPLVLACGAGFALNLTGIGLPPLVGPLLEILGQSSLAVGLLAVGAGLDLNALRQAGPGVAAASLLKLVVLPMTTWLLAFALDIEGIVLAAVVTTAAVPVSATAYVMARQMGGDAPVMAGAITATTLGAAITMPLFLSLAM